jgi:hypothetical protein
MLKPGTRDGKSKLSVQGHSSPWGFGTPILKRISSLWGKPYLHTVSLEPGEDLVHSLLVTNPIHQFISSGVLGGAVSVI